MRIAVLAPATSVHTQRWVGALAERGHELLLLTVHPPSTGDVPPGVDVAVVGRRPPVSYYTAVRAARRRITQFRPDVVHAHYASGYGTLARLVRSSPTVLSVWGSDVFSFPDGSPRRRRLIERNLRFPAAVCATSKVMAARVEALTGREVSPTVIAFGVDTTVFAPRPRPVVGPPVVGTVKTLAPGYRIDDLIRAFALVVSEMPEAVLRIGGSGPQRAELEALAHQLGLGVAVEFLGAIPHREVPDALSSMDVFCALSAEESFGVAVIEASSCGLPVVVSDAGGLPEVVIDGTTGHVVAVGDVAAAADRIIRLLRSPDRGAALGRAGRSFVEGQYEWQRCVDRLEMALREVLAPAKIDD